MSMFNWLRGKVSLNKKRLKEDGFDLDMAYVTPNIIAMGYPASGFESIYRNDFSDVRNFLDQRHGDKYFVYNLCSERSYDPSIFDGRVHRYPFDDHNPPEFDMIRRFCVDADEWLKKDPQNVAVVHCKAGKGRTGVMICALMLQQKISDKAIDVLSEYGRRRTNDEKGVTIPSQRRYIMYYADFMNSGGLTDRPFCPCPCELVKVAFKSVPKKYFTRSLTLKITNMEGQDPLRIETRGNGGAPEKDHSTNTLTYDLTGIFPPYKGDFRIAACKGGNTLWYMWFNSNFIRTEEFGLKEIDKIHKDKSFPEDFRMEVVISNQPGDGRGMLLPQEGN